MLTSNIKRKLTIPDCNEYKQAGKKLRAITAYDYPTAAMINTSPIEIILVGDSLAMAVMGYDNTTLVTMEDMLHHVRPVCRAAKETFVIADMPFGSYNTSTKQGIRNANRMLQTGGADAVKLEGGKAVVSLIKKMTVGGIPVMSHLGFTPQTASNLGGLRIQGKDAKAAAIILEDAQRLEEAGAFALVLECVPTQLAKLITAKLSIPVIGLGAGPACDGQILVVTDMLGIYARFLPKFVKQYANLSYHINQALHNYAREVADGTFPSPEYCYDIDESVLEKLY